MSKLESLIKDRDQVHLKKNEIGNAYNMNTII